MTQDMFLIYADESGYADVSPDAWAQGSAQQGVFVREVIARGGTILSGEGLLPTSTATTVRGDGADGYVVTDGPFAESKEALGGYYIIEATDLDQALGFAKLCPAYGGAVEVRPVMDRSGG